MPPASSDNGEKLISIVSQHWIKYLFPVFLYIILFTVSMLLFILAGIASHHSMWLSHMTFLAALLLFLFTHHWFFIMLLCESSAHIVITDHRVVFLHDRLFIDEQMTEYAFEKMKTVEASKRGILQTILRYGSLKFEGGTGIRLVPHPNRVVKDIEQAMGMK